MSASYDIDEVLSAIISDCEFVSLFEEDMRDDLKDWIDLFLLNELESFTFHKLDDELISFNSSLENPLGFRLCGKEGSPKWKDLFPSEMKSVTLTRDECKYIYDNLQMRLDIIRL